MAQDAEVPSEIEVFSNVALVTDYRFRGVSLSAGDPAIQGGIDIAHSSGFMSAHGVLPSMAALLRRNGA
jgi:uncharacterized protein (TIGR02001 family)